MKQFKTLLIAAILLIGANQISAQTKVAHVDVSEIMGKMPAILDAQKQLQTLGTTYDTEYKKMVDEYQAKLKKYGDESATATEAVNTELQNKESDIMKPIMEKVKASIAKVGKAKGFQYVLDSSTLLLADGTNITIDVKKDLGF
jgi:outer membrane protein